MNLSDAAKKLIEITSNVASTSTMPESVFQVGVFIVMLLSNSSYLLSTCMNLVP